MTEVPEFKVQLATFNLNLPLLLINLEDAYDFTLLLFSPKQQSKEPTEKPSEPATFPDLLNTVELDLDMSRMRGQVVETEEGSRSRERFDRTTTMLLQIQI
jgi:hypothetical protein